MNEDDFRYHASGMLNNIIAPLMGKSMSTDTYHYILAAAEEVFVVIRGYGCPEHIIDDMRANLRNSLNVEYL